MSEATKQWLSSDGNRDFETHICKTNITKAKETRLLNNLMIQVSRSEDDKFQRIYLNNEEINELLPIALSVCDKTEQLKVVANVLSNLSDEELVSFLAEFFTKKVKIFRPE